MTYQDRPKQFKADIETGKIKKSALLAAFKAKQAEIHKSTPSTVVADELINNPVNTTRIKKLKKQNQQLQRQRQQDKKHLHEKEQENQRLKKQLAHARQQRSIAQTNLTQRDHMVSALRVQLQQTKDIVISQQQTLDQQAQIVAQKTQELKKIRAKLAAVYDTDTHMQSIEVKKQLKQANKKVNAYEQQVSKLNQKIIRIRKNQERNRQIVRVPARATSMNTPQALLKSMKHMLTTDPIQSFKGLFKLYDLYFDRLREELPKMPLQNHKARRSEISKSSYQILYGVLHEDTAEPNDMVFIALDGTRYGGVEISAKMPLKFGDVYRGRYDFDSDTFRLTHHYQTAQQRVQIETAHAAKKQKKVQTETLGFIDQFKQQHPDYQDFLTGKRIRIVSWYRRASYWTVFQEFNVDLKILDPSELSAQRIYSELEKADVDLAYILTGGSHHINSQFYKDRPSQHPERIKIVEAISPKEVLAAVYSHFKSAYTREHSK
ncbi:hypothetical protein ACNAN0_01815 [Agrilactobacillus fermenti]|uniref:hypothetical protein n=1 Tax=Agrilactobacillus fermenti TaxID=2586909 RepID=UPI003A5BA503